MGDSLLTIAAAVIGLNLARLSGKILLLLSSAKGLLETEDKDLAFERQNLVLSEKWQFFLAGFQARGCLIQTDCFQPKIILLLTCSSFDLLMIDLYYNAQSCNKHILSK